MEVKNMGHHFWIANGGTYTDVIIDCRCPRETYSIDRSGATTMNPIDYYEYLKNKYITKIPKPMPRNEKTKAQLTDEFEKQLKAEREKNFQQHRQLESQGKHIVELTQTAQKLYAILPPNGNKAQQSVSVDVVHILKELKIENAYFVSISDLRRIAFRITNIFQEAKEL